MVQQVATYSVSKKVGLKLLVVVVVNGSYSAAPYSSPDRECITKVKIKHRQSTQKKVSFEFALERANSLCFTSCKILRPRLRY